MKDSATHHVLLDLPSRYSIYKRIVFLIVSLAVITSCLIMWYSNYGQIKFQLTKQADILGQTLTDQYAVLLEPYVSDKNKQRLEQVAQTLHNDPHVVSVAIYDQRGRTLINYPDQQSIVQMHLNSGTNTSLTYVDEITKDGQILGYLRLTLDESTVIKHQQNLKNTYFTQSQVFMIISLFVGVIVTRLFYKWKINYLANREEHSPL